MKKIPNFVLEHLGVFFLRLARLCFIHLGDCDICSSSDSHPDFGTED